MVQQHIQVRHDDVVGMVGLPRGGWEFHLKQEGVVQVEPPVVLCKLHPLEQGSSILLGPPESAGDRLGGVERVSSLVFSGPAQSAVCERGAPVQ
jgi:hypothetical protein